MVSGDHIHHRIAREWYEHRTGTVLVFCRATQLGLLRLLTTQSVMGVERVYRNEAAWSVCDSFFIGGAAELWQEPENMESLFRFRSTVPQASPEIWADAYIAAFCQGHRIPLLTFDMALGRRTPGSILLPS